MLPTRISKFIGYLTRGFAKLQNTQVDSRRQTSPVFLMVLLEWLIYERYS